MRETIHQALERARLLLLAVALLLCAVPTAQAIRCPTPGSAVDAEQLRLNEEIPDQRQSSGYTVWAVDSEERLGLFVGNSPISNIDPYGLEAGYTYGPGGMTLNVSVPLPQAVGDIGRFATGIGSRQRNYGPDDPIVKDLQISPGIMQQKALAIGRLRDWFFRNYLVNFHWVCLRDGREEAFRVDF